MQPTSLLSSIKFASIEVKLNQTGINYPKEIHASPFEEKTEINFA